MRIVAALPLLLFAVAGANATRKTTASTLTIDPPRATVITRITVRNAADVEVAACSSAEACRTFVGTLASSGRHTIALDYDAADGVAEHFTGHFSAGHGETSTTLSFDLDEDGVIRAMFAQVDAPPIAGVALRVVGPGKYGEVPPIELVNGSPVAIVVRTQDDLALIGVEGGSNQPYAACGTGVGFREVRPGTAIRATRLASIGHLPALTRGHYGISARYGLDVLQEATSGGTRTAGLEIDIDGPPAEPAVEPTLADAIDPMAHVIQERDPGRPPRDFVPGGSGATSPRRARPLALSTIISGTLTPGAAHRYFRVRIPTTNNWASVRFYARCTKPGCSGEAYSVLTDDPGSVSDARDLRASGGWTRLTDDTDMFPRSRETYLVVGCVDHCSQPIQFSGYVYAWTMPDEKRTGPTPGPVP